MATRVARGWTKLYSCKRKGQPGYNNPFRGAVTNSSQAVTGLGHIRILLNGNFFGDRIVTEGVCPSLEPRQLAPKA